MTFLVSTQRTNATLQTGLPSNTIIGGAATMSNAVADNNDATGIRLDARASLDAQRVRLQVQAPALDAADRVYSVGVRVKMRSVVLDDVNDERPLLLGWLRTQAGTVTVDGEQPEPQRIPFDRQAPTDPITSTIQEINLGDFTFAPGGEPWTTANMATLAVELGRGDDTDFQLDVIAFYFDFNYQQPATVELTGPADPNPDTAATLTWDYDSSTFAPPDEWRAAVHTLAATLEAGFDPFVTPALYTSGAAGVDAESSWWVPGEAQQWTTGPLVDGDYVGYCVDMETEILTANGWRKFGDVSVGDIALTLNHETGLSEWQSITHLHHFAPCRRRMLHMEGRGHSSLTTAEHRWPVINHGKRTWKTSESLSVSDAVTIAASCVTLPTEAKYQDAFVELMAWIWTEGHLIFGNPTRKPAGLRICQSHQANPQHCESIRRALTELFGPAFEGDLRALKPVRTWHSRNRPSRDPQPAWREVTRTRNAEFALNTAAAAPFRALMDEKKRVSAEFLTALTYSQLKLFIDTSVDGDGHRTAETTVLIQKDYESVGLFQMACALAGIGTTTGYRESENCYQVVLKRSKHIQPIANARAKSKFSAQWVENDVAVWCPTLPNGTWLARRRGTVFYTGNSQVASQWPGGGDRFLTEIASITWTRDAAAQDPPEPAVLTSVAYSYEQMRNLIVITPGSPTDRYTVERTLDGGPQARWSAASPSLTLIEADGDNPIEVFDRFMPLNTPARYRVVAYAGDPLVAAQLPSNELTVTAQDDRVILRHPTNDLLDTAIELKAPKGAEGIRRTKYQTQGVADFSGGPGTRALPMMMFGKDNGWEYDLTLLFVESYDPDLWARVEQLDSARCPLFLQWPMKGEQLWGGLGPGRAGRPTEEQFTVVPGNRAAYQMITRKSMFTECQPPLNY